MFVQSWKRKIVLPKEDNKGLPIFEMYRTVRKNLSMYMTKKIIPWKVLEWFLFTRCDASEKIHSFSNSNSWLTIVRANSVPRSNLYLVKWFLYNKGYCLTLFQSCYQDSFLCSFILTSSHIRYPSDIQEEFQPAWSRGEFIWALYV